MRRYLVDVVRLTRTDPAVSLGASPWASPRPLPGRPGLRALLAGRRYVIPDDVKDLAGPVLAHRLLVNARSRLQGETAADVVARAVEQAAVPVEDVTGAPRGRPSAVRGWEPDGLAYAAAAFVLFAVLGFVFHIAALAAIGTGGALHRPRLLVAAPLPGRRHLRPPARPLPGPLRRGGLPGGPG